MKNTKHTLQVGTCVLTKSFTLAQLLERCVRKRDRECLFRLFKEASIVDQDFEAACVGDRVPEGGAMTSDFQISPSESRRAAFAADKLNRAAKAFGRRMRRLRDTANLTPTELADLMNVRLVDGGAIIDAEMGVTLYTTEMAKAALRVMQL